MVQYPFSFRDPFSGSSTKASAKTIAETLSNFRGRIPSLQASRLRAIVDEAFNDPNKIAATCCTNDGLTYMLAEEAGFPFVFLGGYMVSSSLGLPDTVCTPVANRRRRY